MEELAMRTHRQQLDHDRYMRDRDRRLATPKAWTEAHPNYHKDYRHRKVSEAIDKEKYLKSLAERIWNLQTQT